MAPLDRLMGVRCVQLVMSKLTTSRDHMGLLFPFAAVGLLYGMLFKTIYPFMKQCLNCSGTQVAAAKVLVVYGIISDCFHIWEYRGRLSPLTIGRPYYAVLANREVVSADYTPKIKERINCDATSQGAKYVVLMFFAAFGYVLSDVCSTRFVSKLAQQEPMAKCGKSQSAIYTVRTTLVLNGELLVVGFCFNVKNYGGKL
ncbi:hypothetical protein KXD40_004348 [Peronospora effusa]|nr:hypothetical protein KXD40_004348 [Peronospora effusa]